MRIVIFVIAALAMTVAHAADRAFPVKPVRLLVPYPPGGGNDTMARTIGAKLTEEWHQQVIIDNRAGANGLVAAELTMAAAPDGYTLFMANIGSHAINPALYKNIPYDAVKDFAPISQLGSTANVLVVHPSVPAKNLQELIALAKAKPGQLNVPVGLGSNIHMSTLEMQQRLGVKWVYVPTKGGQSSVLSVMTGDGDFLLMGVIQTWVHVKAGRLKLLAVSSEQREPMFSEVPTVGETPGLQGYSAGSWQGILGPAKLPPEIVNKLYNEVKRIVAMPDFSEKLTAQGSRPQAKTPQEVGSWLATEKERWAKVVKESGLKID